MADLTVTKEFLETTIAAIEEPLQNLRECADGIKDVAPKGFKIARKDSMIDGLHSLIELVSYIHANYKMIKLEHDTRTVTTKTKRKGGKYKLL